MTVFQPVVNLLVVLTIFSVIAERLTNVLKLQHHDLRERKSSVTAERVREKGIQSRCVLMGIILAIVLKADVFSTTFRGKHVTRKKEIQRGNFYCSRTS